MDMQQAKNALVASLFELSSAATEAATATVNFYKAAGFEGGIATSSSLSRLGETISDAATAAQTALTNGVIDPSTVPQVDAVSAQDSSPEIKKTEKAKRKRAEKDPNAPKKPLTTYLRFNLSIRDDLRKQRTEENQPTLPATELNKIIADKWANLSEPEKEKLQKAYDAEYEQYKKDFDAYKTKKESEALSGPVEDEAAAPIKPAAKKQAVESKSPKKPTPKVPAPQKEVSAKQEKKDTVETAAEPIVEKKKKSSSKKSAESDASGIEATPAKKSVKAALLAEATKDGSATPIKKSKKKRDPEDKERKHKSKKSE